MNYDRLTDENKIGEATIADGYNGARATKGAGPGGREMRITGGYRSFRDAVDEAFLSPIMSPALKYSPVTGFYVESDLITTTTGDVNLGECYYNLNNNGARTPGRGRRSYLEIVARIIEAYEGAGASFDYQQAHAWAFFPE